MIRYLQMKVRRLKLNFDSCRWKSNDGENCIKCSKKEIVIVCTRQHSRRMRTALFGGHRGGGAVPSREGVYLPGEGVYLPGGVPSVWVKEGT